MTAESAPITDAELQDLEELARKMSWTARVDAAAVIRVEPAMRRLIAEVRRLTGCRGNGKEEQGHYLRARGMRAGATKCDTRKNALTR